MWHDLRALTWEVEEGKGERECEEDEEDGRQKLRSKN